MISVSIGMTMSSVAAPDASMLQLPVRDVSQSADCVKVAASSAQTMQEDALVGSEEKPHSAQLTWQAQPEIGLPREVRPLMAITIGWSSGPKQDDASASSSAISGPEDHELIPQPRCGVLLRVSLCPTHGLRTGTVAGHRSGSAQAVATLSGRVGQPLPATWLL